MLYFNLLIIVSFLHNNVLACILSSLEFILTKNWAEDIFRCSNCYITDDTVTGLPMSNLDCALRLCQ